MHRGLVWGLILAAFAVILGFGWASIGIFVAWAVFLNRRPKWQSRLFGRFLRVESLKDQSLEPYLNDRVQRVANKFDIQNFELYSSPSIENDITLYMVADGVPTIVFTKAALSWMEEAELERRLELQFQRLVAGETQKLTRTIWVWVFCTSCQYFLSEMILPLFRRVPGIRTVTEKRAAHDLSIPEMGMLLFSVLVNPFKSWAESRASDIWMSHRDDEQAEPPILGASPLSLLGSN